MQYLLLKEKKKGLVLKKLINVHLGHFKLHSSLTDHFKTLLKVKNKVGGITEKAFSLHFSERLLTMYPMYLHTKRVSSCKT